MIKGNNKRTLHVAKMSIPRTFLLTVIFLLILLTAIELSVGGSSAYTSTV
jgi:hypothetical protein